MCFYMHIWLVRKYVKIKIRVSVKKEKYNRNMIDLMYLLI